MMRRSSKKMRQLLINLRNQNKKNPKKNSPTPNQVIALAKNKKNQTQMK